MRTSGQSVVSHGRQQPVSASPLGHFLLLPSDNSLLLKSIAASEMMLPSDVQSPVEGTSDTALSVVASCLDQVLSNSFAVQAAPDTRNNTGTFCFIIIFFYSQIEFSNSYNPLLVHSDLYKCLISQSIKNNSASKPLKRRFQASQVGKSGQRLMSPKKVICHQLKVQSRSAKLQENKYFSPVLCNSEIVSYLRITHYLDNSVYFGDKFSYKDLKPA